MAEQTPDSIITTQRNGQTIVAELFFNHSSTETFRDKLLKLALADSSRLSALDGQEPDKMRECSFVKYVVYLFPKIDYNQLFDNAKKISNKPKNIYASMDEHYYEFRKSTTYYTVCTGPTQVCRVGEMEVRSGSYPDNFLFDTLIKKEIEKLSKKKVELIVSGNIDYEDYVRQENVFELSND